MPGNLHIWALADGGIFQFNFLPKTLLESSIILIFIILFSSVALLHNVSFKLVWDDNDNNYVYKALYTRRLEL
jgi:hypothetical protein